jgi:hypothetical protein
VVKKIVAFVRAYWKPVLGVCAAIAGVIFYFAFQRGLQHVVGGVGIGSNGSKEQQRDNSAAIGNNNVAIESATKQQRDNDAAIEGAIGVVLRSDEQLESNKSAIDKLDAALSVLRAARAHSGG